MVSRKFFSLALLISIMAGLIGASQPAVLAADSLALVAVSLKPADAIQRFQSTGLPAYALVDGYIIAGADTVGQSTLLRIGLSFKVLDAPLSSGYYLAARMPTAVDFKWGAYGRVLLDLGDQAVLQLSSFQAEKLSLAGTELNHLSLSPMVLPVDQTAEQVFPTSITPDPFVQNIIDQVTQKALKQYDRELAGELPVWVNDAWYTIPTRYTFSGKPIRKAAHYMGEHMAALGLDVEYHVWYDDSNPNVVGEIPGLKNPEDIFVIGGHLDDVQNTPGADDNASGSAATLLAAELLSQYQWDCTLRFAFWTGEEQGYFGSDAYAQRSYYRGENIVGYLNLDMIAYNTIGTSPGIDLVYHPYMPLTQQLAGLMSDVIAAYDLDLVPQLVYSYGGFSDHSSFWDYGYTSIHVIEDENDFNPYYHSSGDTSAHIDLGYFTELTRASLATFLHMGSCLSIGDLDGRITAATNGAAIPSAELSMQNEAGDLFTVQSDDSGYYTQTLPAGTYSLTVSAAGYLTETLSGISVTGDLVTTQDFSLQPVSTEGYLAGRVTDAATGNPLQGVSVIAFPYGDDAMTALDGTYSMTLNAGNYLVTARLFGYLPQTLPATVGISETALLDFALQVAPPEIEMLPPTISVTMLADQSTVRPVYVRNLGDGFLNFSITNPDAAIWLTFAPDNGNVDPSDSQGVSVTLDTTGLSLGVYPTTLEIASNDPDNPIILLPITTTVVSGCLPVDWATISWIPASPLAGEQVTFYASVNGSEPVNYSWEFGDSATSTAVMPTHTFVDAGLYMVTLTNNNDCGFNTVTYPLVIASPPWQSYISLVFKK